MKDSSIKMIIFTEPINKKVSWDIPIEIVNDRYITGQDLSNEKMLGKKPLDKDEAEKYPYVINPENFYKIRHRTKLDINKPYDKAIYDLILISRKIAKSESDYKNNHQSYIGYFYDEVESAKTENQFEENAFKAMKLIHDLPIEKFKSIVTLFNYVSKKPGYIPVSGVSTEIQKNRLLKACRENPEDVMNCFPEYNEGIGEYGYILDLINVNIIRDTGNNEYFFEQKYLGSSIDEVIRTIAKKENQHLKQVFNHRLALKHGTIPQGDITTDKERKNEFSFKLKALKSLAFDQKDAEFISEYQKTMAAYADLAGDFSFREEVKTVENHFKNITYNSEKKEFEDNLKKRDLKSLQQGINSPKSIFSKEDCIDFWDDEQKLRDYMIKTKYPNA
jgi:hypothetical protein